MDAGVSGKQGTTIKGLTPGASYTYRVRTTEAAGTGPSSTTCNASTR